MSQHEPDSKLKRRTVLKGMGASAGAYALGASGFAGSAAAQSSTDLYTITPSTDVFAGEARTEYADDEDWEDAFYDWGIENQELLVIDGDTGNIQSEINLNPTNVAGDTSSKVIQVATLSYNPSDDMLYGIANQFGSGADKLTREDTDQTGRFVFTVDPSNGDLTLVGGPNSQLKNMWGSTFSTDGTTYYGQTGGTGANTNTLFTISVDESSDPPETTTTELFNVQDSLSDTEDPGIEHTGLSWNRLAMGYNIVGVLGNFTLDDDDDLIETNPDILDARIAAENVFESKDVELVSTAFNPCLDGDPEKARIYVIRDGNNFLTADIDNPTQESQSRLTADSDTLINVDNLAEDPVTCATACTRTIGYWKNHGGCKGPKKGKSNKATIKSVLEGDDGCGGFIVGNETVYDGSVDDATPDGIYDFTDDDGTQCTANVPLIVDALDGADAKDMDGQLLAQLLGAKLNVCNGATTSTGTGDIRTTIDWVDDYFSAKVSGDPGAVIDDYIESRDDLSSDTTDLRVKEIWKDILDNYNNQNLALTCE